MARRIVIPYAPRDQFKAYHDRKERWACLVAHRRFGKTVGCVNDLIKRALTCDKPDPRLAYMAPTYTQAKDVAWNYLKHFTNPIPGCDVSESDLSVTLPNKARIRLYGSDNYDRLRGLYLDGVILDEAGDMDPRAWPEVIRPALSDRHGWATFIGTPKGRNGFYDTWQLAQNDEAWFSLMLRASATGVLNADELKDAAKVMTPEQYAQEYECSFDASVIGAYYASRIADAEADGRICGVPYDPAAPVWVGWDLGHGDQTALWFGQFIGKEIHIIDSYANRGEPLDHYINHVKSKPYVYEEQILPHDAEAHELQTGKTRLAAIEGHGLKCKVLPRGKVDDRINAVRMALPRCYFDKNKTAQGIEALRMYRAEEDAKRGILKPKPLHDWCSDWADSFGYLIEGMEEPRQPRKAKPRAAVPGGWMG